MPTDPRRRRRGLLAAVLVLALGVVVVAGAGLLLDRGLGPLLDPEGCSVEVDGTVVDLTTEQAENAATISAVAVRRGLPARAVTIALATAFQESKLRNLDHGDRDSVGIFQQRPSQGWGTVEQVSDPYYATNKFYDALEEVEGYRRMRVTEAAQTVQRSGFPEAYEDHAPDARALASALTGNSPATFSCVVRAAADLEEQTTGPRGLTPRAAAVRRSLLRAFGDVRLGGFAPGGVTTGHMAGSAHYDGRAVDAFVRPVTAENRRRGWAVASYLVAHASRLHVEHVIFDGRIWSERRSDSGWRDYDPGSAAGNRVVLEHRDHVHVDVAEGG